MQSVCIGVLHALAVGTVLASMVVDSPTTDGFSLTVDGTTGENIRCVANTNSGDTSITALAGLWSAASSNLVEDITGATGSAQVVSFSGLDDGTAYYVNCAQSTASVSGTASDITRSSALFTNSPPSTTTLGIHSCITLITDCLLTFVLV